MRGWLGRSSWTTIQIIFRYNVEGLLALFWYKFDGIKPCTKNDISPVDEEALQVQGDTHQL